MTSSIQDDSGLDRIMERMEVKETAAEALAKQEATQGTIKEVESEATPAFATKLEKKKDTTKAELASRLKKSISSLGALIQPPGEIKDSAKKFSNQRQYPELDPDKLYELGSMIKEGSKSGEILASIHEVYGDNLFLANEALDFLLTITTGALAKEVQTAKDDLAKTVKVRLGVPEKELNKEYEKFSRESPDSLTLFDELQKKYGTFDKIQEMILFLLHSLGRDTKPTIGSDMKVKHAAVDEQLQSVANEIRTCQAIYNVYKFYQRRMDLIKKLYVQDKLTEKEKPTLPAQLNFENLAKQFMQLVANRSPTTAAVGQLAPKLGIEDTIPAQIIVFNRMREAVEPGGVSPLIFKSGPTRDDGLARMKECRDNLIAKLEELEDTFADMEELEAQAEIKGKETIEEE